MPDRPDPVAALDRQAASEPSLAKAQLIAQKADRLRSLSKPNAPPLPFTLQLFRN